MCDCVDFTDHGRMQVMKREGVISLISDSPPDSQFPESDDRIRASDQLFDFHDHVLDQSCRNCPDETWSWNPSLCERNEESDDGSQE